MTTDGSVKVTVIVPTHDTAGLVIKNVRSLGNQTMPASDYEVIYVDDGSTDGTGDLVADAIAGRANFSLIRSTNSGWPGRPRNIGLAAARGDFVFFSDDDDWLEHDALERLHARALADGADIVIGRIAGHGRGSHRGVSQAPMSGGDIRRSEHAVLLKSMTVHKLFRRSFLEANRLRFEEGKVRLEDHIFTLRAYLRTQRVSIMHDHTIYHWVRNKEAGNHSYGSLDPEAYASSVDRIFSIIHDEIDDPATRARFVRNWYERKVLKHPPQEHFIRGTPEYSDAIVQANQRLIDKWVPPEADAGLPHNMRVRATLFRLGDTELLRAWGAYERAITLRTRLRSCHWCDDRLMVRFSAELVAGDGKPLTFIRVGGRVLRDVPAPFSGIGPIVEACDVTEALARARTRVLIRKREPTGDLVQPSNCTAIETPHGDHLFAMRYEVEVLIDPMTADCGRPIIGTWDFSAILDLCGHSVVSRICAADNLGIALTSRRMPGTDLVARPVLTSFGNLSLRLRTVAGGKDERAPSVLPRKIRGGARRLRAVTRRTLHGLPRRALRKLPPNVQAVVKREVLRMRAAAKRAAAKRAVAKQAAAARAAAARAGSAAHRD